MTTSEVLHIPGCKCRQAIGDGKGGFLLMVEDYCPVHGNLSKPDRLNLEAAAAVQTTLKHHCGGCGADLSNWPTNAAAHVCPTVPTSSADEVPW